MIECYLGINHILRIAQIDQIGLKMSNGMNIVAHNLQGMFSERQLGIVNNKKGKSIEKLSSGYKVNRAADDAAGLAISEKMRRQIRGLTQGTENAQDGISMCQIADGALSEVDDMLHRLTELSVQAANGTNATSDRMAIQEEVNQIIAEIDRISDTTQFNNQRIFGEDISLSANENNNPTKTMPEIIQDSFSITGDPENLNRGNYTISASQSGVKIKNNEID